MKEWIVRSITVASLMSTSAAIAIDLPQEILFCRTVADAAERTDCYDRAVDALHRSTEQPETAATTPPPDPTSPTLLTTSEPSPTAAEAALPSETPAVPKSPDLVEGEVVTELEQKVADLEQQVAVLKGGDAERSSEPVSSEALFGRDASSSRNIIQEMFGLGEVAQIEATVTEVKRTPYGKLVMVLDNAQIWEQLDSNRLTVKTGEGVLIKSAKLGSFLLEKQNGSRSIRVKRID